MRHAASTFVALAISLTAVAAAGPLIPCGAVASLAGGCLEWEIPDLDSGVSAAPHATASAAPDGSSVAFVGADYLDNGRYAGYAAAVDAASGRVLWRAENPEAWADVRALHTPDGRLVVVAGERFTPETHLDVDVRALDAATGALVWRSGHPEPVPFNDYVSDLAIAPDGRAAYVAGIHGGRLSNPLHLTAFDVESGALRWSHREPLPTRGYWDPKLAITPDGGSVLAATTDRERLLVVAFDSENGAAKWSTTWDARDTARVRFAAVLDDGTLVVGLGVSDRLHGHLVAFDAVTGEARWDAAVPVLAGAIRSDPAFALAGGTVFVSGVTAIPDPDPDALAGSRYHAVVAAVDGGSGQLRWLAAHPPPEGADARSARPGGLAVSAEAGIVASATLIGRDPRSTDPVPLLVGHDTATGIPLWSVGLGPDALPIAAAVAGDRLVALGIAWDDATGGPMTGWGAAVDLGSGLRPRPAE